MQKRNEWVKAEGMTFPTVRLPVRPWTSLRTKNVGDDLDGTVQDSVSDLFAVDSTIDLNSTASIVKVSLVVLQNRSTPVMENRSETS